MGAMRIEEMWTMCLLLIFFINVSVHQVEGQTCRDDYQYDQCSTNTECGCLPMTSTKNGGICVYLARTCSELELCADDNRTCHQPGHMCVMHPRCNNRPMCYPLDMSSQYLCPPLPPTPTPTPRPYIRADALPRATHICPNATWTSNGVIVAGGGWGTTNDKLAYPSGLDVDDEQTVYVTDLHNHRVMAWKKGATTGEVVIGYLALPTDVIIDRKTDNLIICDSGNRRVVRQSRLNSTNRQTIISNVDCSGLALDDKGALYVSDINQSVVRRYYPGQSLGEVVAGANGQGDRLDQFNIPRFIFVDRDYSVYVADANNHRIMKWMKDAKEGIVVAGGPGSGDDPAQLSNPRGVIVDQLGTMYVGSYWNSGIKRWTKGATHGDVLIGQNGEGVQSNPLAGPSGIAFDRRGNLYVADLWACTVWRFDIDKSLCS